MFSWFKRRKKPAPDPSSPEAVLRKYSSFRSLLAANNECLELLSRLQENLGYAPPLKPVAGDLVNALFDKTGQAIESLEALSGEKQIHLRKALAAQREEVERHMAALEEAPPLRLSASLDEVGLDAAAEVGEKAAYLGEIRNRLRLPVPPGFVLTAEAYRRFCGLPCWRTIRDVMRDTDPNDPARVARAAADLAQMVAAAPMPRAVEVAIAERARMLCAGSHTLAVRSSAVGEGGARSFAGQFLTLLNVPEEEAVAAYRKVVASRFTERALSYRLSGASREVDSPLAVLFLPLLRARAAGILYTRDPSRPRGKEIWITATRGLGLEIASGEQRADLFVVARKPPHAVLQRTLVSKDEQLRAGAGGGLQRVALDAAEASAPSLDEDTLRRLASWALRIEDHFRAPQDVEWVLEESGQLYVVQSRPLSLAEPSGRSASGRPKQPPLASGGRTIYPGKVSGTAYVLDAGGGAADVPPGAILFLRKVSPDIMKVLPRAGGLVAEWGNVAGHAAALLREFKVPSVFLMEGALHAVQHGAPVSLDAARACIYAGTLWPRRDWESGVTEEARANRHDDPLSRRILALNLVDPTSAGFRDKACRSVHDVLRYCHEKAVEAMFRANDLEAELSPASCRRLRSNLPLNVFALDLGQGMSPGIAGAEIDASEIVSRPFIEFWKGVCHPGVSWTRDMPIRFGDLASVLAGSLSTSNYVTRSLGERSFLLVARDYFNLNARLAYHFTLIDACLCDTPSANSISFRFAGGGATRPRRNLRAEFISACLASYGFQVDRRGDLVNAWFKAAPAEMIAEKLDILGRLTACTCQLDMYMTSREVMQWYVRQFLEGNYSFTSPEGGHPSAAN